MVALRTGKSFNWCIIKFLRMTFRSWHIACLEYCNHLAVKMKLKNTLLTIISGAFLATGAHAVTYSDFDLYNGWNGRLVNAANPLNGTFQISYQDADGINDVVGYDPLTQQITSATANFLLYDDSFYDGSETVTITLGPDAFISSQATFLFALGSVTGSALFDLDADGILTYSMIANSGDFRASYGALIAYAEPRGVPDGGMTAIFLGMGFLGISAFRRKCTSIR
jgi:hypothetical protein